MPLPVESLQHPLNIYDMLVTEISAWSILGRIKDLNERLARRTMATQLSHVADEANRDGLSFHEFLGRLLQAECHEQSLLPLSVQ